MDVESTFLEVVGQFALQAAQAFPRVDGVGVEPPVRRHRNVQEVHMRRFLIHVDHGGDDVLASHESGEEVAALLEEAPLFFKDENSPLCGEFQKGEAFKQVKKRSPLRDK